MGTAGRGRAPAANLSGGSRARGRRLPTRTSSCACPCVLLYSGRGGWWGLPAILIHRLDSPGHKAPARQRASRRLPVARCRLCDGHLPADSCPVGAGTSHNGHPGSGASPPCKAHRLRVFFTNMYISILLLCCISCDRYVGVGYALESRGVRRRSAAMAVTAVGAVAVMVAHVPVFLTRESEVHVGGAYNVSETCFEPGHSHTGKLTAFNYGRFVLGFALPLVLLSAANHGVLRAVRASVSLRPRQKRRVRALAVAVVTMFLVCFAPYHLVLLARAVSFHFLPREVSEVTCSFSQWIYTPYSLSLGLSTLNSACNPILYVLSSEDVRKELSVMLRCRRGVGGPGARGGWGTAGTTFTVAHATGAHTTGTAVRVDAPAGPEDYSSLKNEVDSSGSTGVECLGCLMTPKGRNVPVGLPVNLIEEQEDAP
ncbi:hypothetical protein CRUP_033116 [Coryphaenoides rupestris]|nr:hypothetical protein CRUP_033116 [Coryphaenoides rupestris]